MTMSQKLNHVKNHDLKYGLSNSTLFTLETVILLSHQ